MIPIYDSINTLLNANGPGVAISCIRGGNIVFNYEFSYANIEHQIPIRRNSVFNIASITKQFTATGIIILQEQGKLHFDDSMVKYIPELKHYATDVKIKHLIYHSSGLTEFYDLLYNIARNNCLHATNSECLELLTKQKHLIFLPGEKFAYCNSNYVLLALIIERITGQSFTDFMAEHIFQPLQMNNTYVFDEHQPLFLTELMAILSKMTN